MSPSIVSWHDQFEFSESFRPLEIATQEALFLQELHTAQIINFTQVRSDIVVTIAGDKQL